MKTIPAIFRLLPAMLLLFLMHLHCTQGTNVSDLGGTSETTSAKLSGTIWDDAGRRAGHVPIRFSPADFNATLANSSQPVDSTYTDKNGEYAFTIPASGYYTIHAEQNGKYCMEDSIYCSIRYNVNQLDDTLKSPGSIAGTVVLEEDGDLGNVVILLLGSTIYTTVDTNSGSFLLSPVPEGRHTLRIMTIDKLYGYIDTTITIQSARQSTIGEPLLPPFNGVRKVRELSAVLDTSTMLVTLSWPACDTAAIIGYYLYRTTMQKGEPFAIIDPETTSFTDDIFQLDPDSLPDPETIRYAITAVGRDRSESELTFAPDVQYRTMLTFIDSVQLPQLNTLRYHNGVYEVTLTTTDSQGSLIFAGTGWIIKFSADGSRHSTYEQSVKGDCFIALTADHAGNVIVYQRTPGLLLKLSPELLPTDSAQLHNVPVYGNYGVVTDPDDTIYLFLNGGLDTTFVIKFDPSCNEISRDTIFSYVIAPVLNGDKIYLHGLSPDGAGIGLAELPLYDYRTGIVSHLSFPPFSPMYLSHEMTHAWRMLFTSDNTPLVTEMHNSGSTTILKIDSERNPVARFYSKGTPLAYRGNRIAVLCDNLVPVVYFYQMN